MRWKMLLFCFPLIVGFLFFSGQAAFSGGGGIHPAGITIDEIPDVTSLAPVQTRSLGRIMDRRRRTVYSETGAVYWNSKARRFIVSPDYYHRQFSGDNYVNKGKAKKKRTFNVGHGQTLKFKFNRRRKNRWMNVSIRIKGTQTYLWGDPHWYYKARKQRRWTWAYELPDVTSYWFDILNDENDPDDDISIEFQCYLERWNLSVITKTLVYKIEKGKQVRYVFDEYGKMQKQVLQ